MTEQPVLQPLRAPTPERPFKCREPELQLIAQKLESACRGQPGALLVTCFWGVAGIGKSWLLGRLKDLYERLGEERSVCGSFESLAARVDLDRSIGDAFWSDDRLDRKRVVRELWSQLAEQIGADLPALDHLGEDDLAGQFVDQVMRWLEHFRPLLLLDTVDDLVREDEESFFWLEKQIVAPLAITNRVVFVFASRGELRRWQLFQVRRRVDLWPLVAFDPPAAGAAVRANAEASRAIYRHAFGHPLATEYLARLLENAGIILETATEEELKRGLQPDLVRTALRSATQHILAKVPSDLARQARAASVLRWVNAEPLQYLAEKLGWKSQADYSDLIGQLQAHHLLYWNLDTGAYEFPSGVGALLSHALELEDPELFWTAHRAAYEFHRNHLENHPRYLARYVPGAAYHSSILARGGRLVEANAFGRWWETFLAHRAPKEIESWDELVKSLERDEMLRQVMTAREFGELQHLAKARAAHAG